MLFKYYRWNLNRRIMCILFIIRTNSTVTERTGIGTDSTGGTSARSITTEPFGGSRHIGQYCTAHAIKIQRSLIINDQPMVSRDRCIRSLHGER